MALPIQLILILVSIFRSMSARGDSIYICIRRKIVGADIWFVLGAPSKEMFRQINYMICWWDIR